MKLGEITNLLDGILKGDPEMLIDGAYGIKEAAEGHVTVYKGYKPLDDLTASAASAVIVKEELAGLDKAQIIVSNPSLAFGKLCLLFYGRPFNPKGIMPGANVAEGVCISNNVSVYPGVYIDHGATVGDGTTIYPGVYIGENSEIGKDCIIHANVTIREDSRIGNRVIIQPGAVIGSDGFGYEFENGRHFKIPQVGRVVIEDDVEVGANVTIDRATSGVTLIGAGTKIDNMVQIAHNVKIGKHSLIVAQTGIAGSSEIGDYVVLAGQVGVSDHTMIESGTQIGAQSGVMGKVKKGAYMGSPAMPHLQYKRSYVLFKRLPELNDRLQELEKWVFRDNK